MGRLTIDESITHAKEVADKNSGCWKHCKRTDNDCDICEEEHEQLAEWLEELKMYKSLSPRELVSEKQRSDRDIEYHKGFTNGYSKAENDYYAQSEKDRQSSYDCGYEVGYNKAIDDFVKELCKAFDETTLNDDGYYPNNVVRSIAEQLKVGVENE